jgi:hypothetical protein
VKIRAIQTITGSQYFRNARLLNIAHRKQGSVQRSNFENLRERNAAFTPQRMSSRRRRRLNPAFVPFPLSGEAVA